MAAGKESGNANFSLCLGSLFVTEIINLMKEQKGKRIVVELLINTSVQIAES